MLKIILTYVIEITDMQKFPLRMKDNDLLVTELYKDPANDQITSISVYLTPKTTSKLCKVVEYLLEKIFYRQI